MAGLWCQSSDEPGGTILVIQMSGAFLTSTRGMGQGPFTHADQPTNATLL